MADVQAAVRAYAGVAMSPAEVCTRGNSLLHEILLPESSSPFLYGILRGAERSFRYCNADHLHLILFHDGSTATPDHNGAVLGVFPAWNCEDSKINLERGDRLLLFTDGITEATDAQGREFEEGNIAHFPQNNRALSAA